MIATALPDADRGLPWAENSPEAPPPTPPPAPPPDGQPAEAETLPETPVEIPANARCAVCRDLASAEPTKHAEPRPAQRACLACGRFVCAAHHWTMLGICKGCASEEQVRALRTGKGPQNFKELLKIKWVE